MLNLVDFLGFFFKLIFLITFIFKHLIYWKLILFLFFFRVIPSYTLGREVNRLTRVDTNLFFHWFFLNNFFSISPRTLSCLTIKIHNFIWFIFNKIVSISQSSWRFYILTYITSGLLFFLYIVRFFFLSNYLL